jgi:hypothetical protein
MRWLRILRLRFRSLFRQAALDRDLEDELRFHFEHQVERNIAAGMGSEEARYAVRNLRRDPFLALAATVTLAICIGANTTAWEAHGR